MQKKNWIALALLSVFVLAVIGCDAPKNVVPANAKKIGMTAQERKEKRGE